MADEKPVNDPTAEPQSARRSKTRNAAKAEFDRYKARVTARGAAPAGLGVAAPAGFAAAPSFSIGGAGAGYVPGMAGMPGMMVGSPWSGGTPGGALGFPYGPMQVPPPLPENSLTERLRYTLRLGVDLVNATLAGGLRVVGGLSDAAMARGAAHGGCGCGHTSCGCTDCCTTCDPCCHSGVSSCGCGHC